MKVSYLFVPLLSVACATAFAAGQTATPKNPQGTLGTVRIKSVQPIRGQLAINLLALETDLTPRQVRSLLSHGPEDSYMYFTSAKAEDQLHGALGDARYDALNEGRPIPLYSAKVMQAVHAIAASAPADSSGGVILAMGR